MSSKESYIKKFKELLDAEKKARDYYKYYIDRIEDVTLLEQFREIYKDEQKHVGMVESIIEAFNK